MILILRIKEDNPRYNWYSCYSYKEHMSLKRRNRWFTKCGQVHTVQCAFEASGGAGGHYPFATIEPNVGVVAVPDDRLAKLAEIVHTSVLKASYDRICRYCWFGKRRARGRRPGEPILEPHPRDGLDLSCRARFEMNKFCAKAQQPSRRPGDDQNWATVSWLEHNGAPTAAKNRVKVAGAQERWQAIEFSAKN